MLPSSCAQSPLQWKNASIACRFCRSQLCFSTNDTSTHIAQLVITNVKRLHPKTSVWIQNVNANIICNTFQLLATCRSCLLKDERPKQVSVQEPKPQQEQRQRRWQRGRGDLRGRGDPGQEEGGGWRLALLCQMGQFHPYCYSSVLKYQVLLSRQEISTAHRWDGIATQTLGSQWSI